MLELRVLGLDELDRNAWVRLLDSSADATVFHTWQWAEVLEQSFASMQAQFFVFEASREYKCGFPAVVESRPPVRRFLSMPFGSYGGMVTGSANEEDLEMLAEEVTKYCLGERMWHTEIADFSGALALSAFSAFEAKETHAHILDLSGGFDHVWTKRFNKNIRKMVRQAKKKGVIVRPFSGEADVERYIALAEHTLKRRSGVTRELALYANCMKTMGPSGNAVGHLAWWEDKPVAGAIHLVGGGVAMNWLSASDSRYWHVRPNNIVVCRVIEEMCKRGLESYNFGSSPASATELIRYKESWGAKGHRYTHRIMTSRRYRALRLLRRILPI